MVARRLNEQKWEYKVVGFANDSWSDGDARIHPYPPDPKWNPGDKKKFGYTIEGQVVLPRARPF
jgi:hypothetical protein